MGPPSEIDIPAEWAETLRPVEDELRRPDGVLIALSGGTDSSLLLALAARWLPKDKLAAATAVGPMFPQAETRRARAMATQAGVALIEVPFDPQNVPEISANPPDRCYHCKRAILSALSAEAERSGLEAIATGTNSDDLSDYRPGLRAEEEFGVIRPYLAGQMGKAAIRAVSRALGLATAEVDSAACLASRVPYGHAIRNETLARIERAESGLAELGLAKLRVRDHGDLARLEVAPDQIPRAAAERERIVAICRQAGYRYVTLDLTGYRTGSLNEGVVDGG